MKKPPVIRRQPRMLALPLTTNQRNIAKLAGNGTMSRGIRVALEWWLETHPDVRSEYRKLGQNHPLLKSKRNLT